jgi:hypothetical protein
MSNSSQPPMKIGEEQKRNCRFPIRKQAKAALTQKPKIAIAQNFQNRNSSKLSHKNNPEFQQIRPSTEKKKTQTKSPTHSVVLPNSSQTTQKKIDTHFVLYKNPSQNNPKSKYTFRFLKKKKKLQYKLKSGNQSLTYPKMDFHSFGSRENAGPTSFGAVPKRWLAHRTSPSSSLILSLS